MVTALGRQNNRCPGQGLREERFYTESSFATAVECVCVCAQWFQSCLNLCNPMDCSPPGSSVHGILQARILEWVAMPSSRGSSGPRDQTWISCTAGRFFTTEPPRKPAYCRVSSVQLSRVQLCVTPWTAACQASLYITNFQSSLKLMSSGG